MVNFCKLKVPILRTENLFVVLFVLAYEQPTVAAFQKRNDTPSFIVDWKYTDICCSGFSYSVIWIEEGVGDGISASVRELLSCSLRDQSLVMSVIMFEFLYAA